MPNKPPPVLLVPPPPNAEPVPKPRLQEVARQRDWFFVAGPCHPLSSSQVSLIIEGIRRWVGHGTVKVEVLKPRDCLARVSSPSRVDVRSTGLVVETGWHPGQGSRYKQKGRGARQKITETTGKTYLHQCWCSRSQRSRSQNSDCSGQILLHRHLRRKTLCQKTTSQSHRVSMRRLR